jgi:hypothetical protein
MLRWLELLNLIQILIDIVGLLVEKLEDNGRLLLGDYDKIII